MPILDQYGNPVSSGSGGRFASSANRGDRAMPPEPLFTDNFDKLVPDFDRKALVSGSRKMFMNFPPYKGAITMKADHVVGRAWNPKFIGEDKDWGRIATLWLKDQWYGMSDYSGSDFKSLLWLDCVALDRDGDYIIVLDSSESGWPMTRRISANRIGQRVPDDSTVMEGRFKGAKMRQGVIYGNRRVVVGYNILGETYTDDVQIAVNECIYNADKDWHDQSRGLPTGSSSLKFIRGSLLSHEWEQMAQLMVSSIGLVEYNEQGGPDTDDPGYKPPVDENGKPIPHSDRPTTEILQNGTIRYFRSNSGGKIEQIKHERPGDMWDKFQDRVIRIMSKDVKVPYELTWKSNEINAAMVRNVQEQMRMAVEDRQDTIEYAALRLIRWAIAKAVKEGILPRPKTSMDWWKWEFIKPRKFSVDAGRDAAQRREDYKLGLTNKSKIVLEEGGDLELLEDDRIDTVFRYEKKIREREALEGFTVDRRKFEMLTANEMPAENQAPVQQQQEETNEEETES